MAWRSLRAEGTAAETPVQLTPTASADIVRQEIQRGLDPLDAKITTLQSTVEGRLDSVEAELLSHHSKIVFFFHKRIKSERRSSLHQNSGETKRGLEVPAS
jgi:hypothetical protein